VLVMGAGAPAFAQVAQLTPSDHAAIHDFNLDTDVLHRLQAVTAKVHALHIDKTRLDTSKVHSLDDMAEQLLAVDPRIKSILADNGFTARQFLVANLALVSTVMMVNYGKK